MGNLTLDGRATGSFLRAEEGSCPLPNHSRGGSAKHTDPRALLSSGEGEHRVTRVCPHSLDPNV